MKIIEENGEEFLEIPQPAKRIAKQEIKEQLKQAQNSKEEARGERDRWDNIFKEKDAIVEELKNKLKLFKI